jgi:cyclophilin family peptidyl-prolyl cis-trans isomerase
LHQTITASEGNEKAAEERRSEEEEGTHKSQKSLTLGSENNKKNEGNKSQFFPTRQFLFGEMMNLVVLDVSFVW